jgi:hypothetical protein
MHVDANGKGLFMVDGIMELVDLVCACNTAMDLIGGLV